MISARVWYSRSGKEGDDISHFDHNDHRSETLRIHLREETTYYKR